jgi:putative amidase-like protein
MGAVVTLSLLAVLGCGQLEPMSNVSATTVLLEGGVVEHAVSTADFDKSGAGRVILHEVQNYLTDQVNSATENPRFNRSRGTNVLPWSMVDEPLASVLKDEMPKVESIRNYLRGTPAEHDWGKADFRGSHIDIRGDVAKLTGVEYAELHYKSLPKSYTYWQRHYFEFRRIGGSWRIRKDDLSDRVGVVPTPYVRHPLLGIIHDNVAAISPELARPVDPQVIPNIKSLPRGLVVPPPLDRYLVASPNAKPDPYDGNLAATYARKWANSYNSTYPQYNDDCTNFISQALKAGGWTEDHDWYSNANAVVRATGGRGATGLGLVGRAWSEAQGLWEYGTRSGGRFAIYSASPENRPHAPNMRLYGPARPGDIVFADWDSGGRMQHTMLVTAVSGSGRDWRRVQVSAHTAPELDRALPDIVASAVANDDKDARKIGFFYGRPAA